MKMGFWKMIRAVVGHAGSQIAVVGDSVDEPDATWAATVRGATWVDHAAYWGAYVSSSVL